MRARLPLGGLPPAGAAAFGGLALTVTVLAAAGALPRWPGLVHLVALPPLDVLADTRWLLTRSTGPGTFVAGLLVTLAVRTLVLAVLLGGPTRQRLAFAARFYGVALVPALLAAQMHFSGQAALYSRLFWTAVVIGAVTVAVLAAAPWSGSTGSLRAALRDSAASGLRIWLLAAYAVGLLALGAAAEIGGPAGAVAAVPVSAALTLTAMARLRRPARADGRLQLATAAVAVAGIAALVVTTRGTPPPDPVAERDGSLLVMSGINSASGEGAIFELEPERLGYTCEQKYYFSYAGTGEGQPRGDAACPIRTGAPYEPEHTQRPFDEQVALLAAQVDGLPDPVVVIGHSQAAWVAWEAASRGRLDGVEAVVLLGPFPESPVAYPPPGERGTGRVGGDGFRALEPLIEAAGFDFAVDAPLSRELLAQPDAARAVFASALPDHVRAVAVTAVPDLALMPRTWRIEGAQDACPVREAHPYLPLTPGFWEAAVTFLEGGSPGEPCPAWRPAVRVVARALGVPHAAA